MTSETAFITPLPHMSIITVAGEQRHDYLHGQLTVATKQFDTDRARLSAHCDFKGKMFSASILSDYQEQFIIAAEAEAAKETFAQLKKYGVFSKVDITLSDTFAIYGASGDAALNAIKVLFESVSNEHLASYSNEFGQVICFNDTSVRFLLYLNEKGQARLNDIEDGLLLNVPERWNTLEIEAGIGNVQAETIGEFVPQMLNFQCLNAIDFDKGCYMGQEVVARTKFLGKNKRACFILEGELDETANEELQDKLKAGSNIEMQLGDNWRRGGVVNRFSCVNGKIHMLAVMSNDTEAGSVVRLKDTDVRLTVKQLPYQLD